MFRKRSGISLVEITIGFTIFTLIGIYFLSYTMSASKEIALSGDHINAVILSQKVGEDLLEEIAINPYGLKTLGVPNAAGQKYDVVDGSSIFFSYIEDRAAPWGIIEPTQDGMIDNRMPMYETVKKFRFGVYGDRLAKSGDHEDRNLVACNVDFFWEAGTGRGEFNTAFQAFAPVTLKKVSPGDEIDEAAIDARIPDEVFGVPGRTIGEIAAVTGENQQTILALGRISLICNDFSYSSYFADQKNTIARGYQRLQGLSAAGNPGEYFATSYELAKAWYDMGKSCYRIVAYLAPHFAELQSQGKFDSSLGLGFSPITFQHHMMSYQLIYEYFVTSIVQARYYYYNLLRPEIVRYKGNRVQQEVILRLIDLYRLTAVIATRPGGMAEYRDFLNRIENVATNRNPFLARMITHEQRLLQNRNEWFEHFPNLARIESLVGGKMPGILDFIERQTVAMIKR